MWFLFSFELFQVPVGYALRFIFAFPRLGVLIKVKRAFVFPKFLDLIPIAS